MKTYQWFASLVVLPDLIDAPGKYKTRCGEIVEVTEVSSKNDFWCVGTYP